MSKFAWSYIWNILIIGAGLLLLPLHSAALSSAQLATCGLLVVLATLAQLYKAEGRDHQALYATGIFWFAGVVLLDPLLFNVVIVVPHLVQWLKERREGTALSRIWYLQPFNVAMYLIAGTAARSVYGMLLPDGAIGSFPGMIALTGAALSYLFVNQVILGLALVLARGLNWRETGVLSFSSLLPEFIMLCLGASFAGLWNVGPWLIPLALSPLVLIYQSLHIPKLKREAQTDSKTGLLNAGYFTEKYAEEFDRAVRFSRPLSFIMADLDYLRNINNSYGHLAGDAVLTGIAAIMRQTVRQYGWVGRFGGEEFAVILPETQLSEAAALADRIRLSIAAACFEAPGCDQPISATMSFGVACFPHDGTTTTELSHIADVALYRAKSLGRNCVVAASTGEYVTPACLADMPLLTQGDAITAHL